MFTSAMLSTDLRQRGRDRRRRTAVLAIALVGSASVLAVGHEAHDGERTCVVCQLRHQPAATSPGSIRIEPADTSEAPVRTADGGAVFLACAPHLPARAPPACAL